MKDLETLHPVAQVAAIIVVGAIACVFIWQFYKTIREF